MAKYIMKILVEGCRVIGKAFVKSIRDEVNASREAARLHYSAGDQLAADGEGKKGISLEEAKLILNVADVKDSQRLRDNYAHLFAVNDKIRGGSFYLQSKVYRAKERIDEELRRLQRKGVERKKAKSKGWV